MTNNIIKKKYVLVAILFFAFILLIFSSVGASSIISRVIRHCKDFKSREEAQKAYDLHPKLYAGMDKDHDKLVCEYTHYQLKK